MGFEINERYNRRLWIGVIVASLLVLLGRNQITEALLRFGTESPFGLLPRYQLVQLLVLVAIGWTVGRLGFGLASFVGVSFALVFAYYAPCPARGYLPAR